MSTVTASRDRYPFLDALRGLTLLSMIAYHTCWDLVYLFGADWAWYRGSGAYVWQQSICWTFILLSGFCWPMGRHPLRRGTVVSLCGGAVMLATAVTMPGQQVWFGVLTLIGSAMLLMIPLEPLLRRLSPGMGLAGSLLLFVLLRNIGRGFLGFESWNLWALPAALYRNYFTAYLGFPQPGFASTDYFPLFPWLFLFLAGYFLYRLCRSRLPYVRAIAPPPLCTLGRWSLPIYMFHQPLVYGVLLAGDALLHAG